jgi:hypothetical protein
MPNHSKGVNLTVFKGLNNVSSPENTDLNYLKKALNVNIDKTGNVYKRKGYTKVDTANYSSLYTSDSLGTYAVRNGDLVMVNPDYSTTLIRAGVGNVSLSFQEVDDIIYYTSTTINGTITLDGPMPFGIQKNPLDPNLVQTIGALPEGTYQVAFTYVNSDYKESGVSRSSVITVPSGSGITFTIPNNPDPTILYARVYCSTQNGEVLYYSGIGTLGLSYFITSTAELINPIRTFNIDAAPLGQIVKFYKGRLYIAEGSTLWYSEPYSYEWYRLDTNFHQFPSEILEIMPVEDGMWIASDYLYYLSGNEPEKFNRSLKEKVKIIKGTGTLISGSYIHMDNTPTGYKWLVSSDLGIFILFNQGMCINLTSQNVELEKADLGTSLFLQDSGTNQYMSILKTNENPNNSVLGDMVESVIIRNGVVIP